MSIKFAYLPLTVIVALGMMASGCSKHSRVIASKTPNPAVPQSAPSDSGRQQTAAADTTSRQSTTSSSTPPSTSISKAERDTLNQRLAKLEDVLFDYDKATIRPDATKTLEGDVAVIRGILERYPNQKVKIEGHADERGSDEYNIALGDKRAVAAKEFLSGMGINASQLDIVSFGKQRPVCQDHSEDCWQKNRRAHFVAEGGPQ